MSTPQLAALPPPTMLRALGRALWSLTHPKVFWHVTWPVLVSFSVWGVILLSAWWWLGPVLSPYLASGEQMLPSWMLGLGLSTVVMVLTHLILAVVLLPIMTLTFVILLSLISMPLILPIVAKKHYPHLAMSTDMNVWQNVGNTVKASLLFLLIYALSWLLFFIPNAVLAAHWFAVALLNKQTFAFDALSVHASRAELQQVLEEKSRPMIIMGGLVSFLSYIPLLNLLTPAMAGLWFIHYSLMALENLRTQQPEVILLPQK